MWVADARAAENFYPVPDGGVAGLPGAEQALRGVTFRIGEGVVQLGSTNLPDESAEVPEVEVQRKISRLGQPSPGEVGRCVGLRIGGMDTEAAPFCVALAVEEPKTR